MSQHITPGRVVALLTPTVIAPAAGWIAVELAKIGMDVDSMQLQAVFVAGATSALGIGALWLKGWQDWEKRQEETPAGVSNDLRIEESEAPRSLAVAESSADANGSVHAAEPASDDLDALEEELAADGFDEELEDLDEDLELIDEDELVVHGEE